VAGGGFRSLDARLGSRVTGALYRGPDSCAWHLFPGGETEVRLRGRTPLIDIRPLGEVLPSFERHGFVRIHHQHAVNPNHVRLLRLQADGRDWEVKMDPPVNLVLPIARDRLGGLRGVFGGGG
jgi:hypothetical protein